MDTSRFPALTGAQGQRGNAIVAMLLIFGALSVLSVGLMVFSTTEIRIADNQRDHTAALYVAEAGVTVLNIIPVGKDPLAIIEQVKEWTA